MTKVNGRRSLALLLIIPVLLVVQLLIGLSIYENMKRSAWLEANNNKLDVFVRANSKYVSHGESAQRGYLLTGQRNFYDAYESDLSEWTKNDESYDTLAPEVRRPEVAAIKDLARKKWTEMSLTIDLYNNGSKDSSLGIVKTGYGKMLMDSLRAKSLGLRNELNAEVVSERKQEWHLIYAFFAIISTLITLSLLIIWLTYRAFNGYTKSLEKMVAELEEANAKMRKYHYNSYHSLRTPLRNITGFLKLLSKKYEAQFDDEAREYVGFIDDGVKQLSEIIVDMRRKYLLREMAPVEQEE